MSKKIGGLIFESPNFKDFDFNLVFGAAPFMEEIKPLGRDISDIPVICQGSENTCVSATLTWIRQWMDKNKPDLSHEWLACISNTGERGAKPSQVLEPARKIGIIPEAAWMENLDFEHRVQLASEYKLPGYFYVRDLSKYGLYHALKSSVLAIGVKDWMGVGPHFMAAYDVNEEGLMCVNWWNENEQDKAVVPFEKVVIAVAFNELPEGMDKSQARLPFFNVLNDKLRFLFNKYVTI